MRLCKYHVPHHIYQLNLVSTDDYLKQCIFYLHYSFCTYQLESYCKFHPFPQFSSVQFSSVARSCPTLCDPMNRSTPGLPVHHHFLEFTQTHIHRVRDAIWHLIFCRPLLLLPPISPSIRVFPSESTLRMRWPKYWSFSFSIIPSKEIPGMILMSTKPNKRGRDREST